MRLLIHAVATIALIVLVSPASATFFTYAEWAALPEYGRALYIAGLYDALTTFTYHIEEDHVVLLHFRQCIGTAKNEQRSACGECRGICFELA